MSDEGWDGDVADAGPPADDLSPVPASPRPAPGWYLDPWERTRHRFWNGQTWTSDTFPNGPAAPDFSSGASAWGNTAPLSSAPPPPGSWAPAGDPAPPPEWAAEPAYLGWGGAAPPPGIGQPDDGAPPPRKSGRAAFLGALIVGLIIGFGVVVGFLLTVDHHKSNVPSAAPLTPQQPATTQPPLFNPGTPAAPTDPSASVLSGLVLQQDDVPGTVIVQPVASGDQTSGDNSATLDLCNGTFPSESLRTARLQVEAVDAQIGATLDTEAVLYSNPAATAQAFAELKSTAAGCPATPVTSPVGEPTHTTRFNAAPDAAWPQTPTVDRLAYDFVATDQSGQADHAVSVYLRRGRVLMGLYFHQPDAASQTSVAGQTTIAGIVNVFATRMAQLPVSVVNGG